MRPAEIRMALHVGQAVRTATEMVIAELGSPSASDLAGACFIASHTLAGVLQDLGVRATLVHGGYLGRFSKTFHDCHCWVALPDGRLLDLTATQFGVPDPVHVVPVHKQAAKYDPLDRGVFAVKVWRETGPSRHLEYSRRVRRFADRILGVCA